MDKETAIMMMSIISLIIIFFIGLWLGFEYKETDIIKQMTYGKVLYVKGNFYTVKRLEFDN